MAQTILIVDDEPDLREIFRLELEEGGYDFIEAKDGASARKKIEEELPNLVLLDLNLPDENGIAILQWMRMTFPAISAIVISGAGSIEMAVESVKLGAFDYIEKPLDPSRLRITVENALKQVSLSQDIDQLKGESTGEGEIIGSSDAMKSVFEMIYRAAPTDASVLITGESGVGKELVANAIQGASNRKDKPYIKLNCAAIHKDLIESELFGHVKGAFTGAVGTKVGKFELADGGTLFLDEIGDMSATTQAKVLRFLQEGEVQRVGGTSTRKTDVRVLAATNKNLEKEIVEKNFRGDLYYRLNVVSIKVPPLRERSSDIPQLVDHFLQKHGSQKGRRVAGISDEVRTDLQDYDWPGNVRELENVIERSIILSGGDVISSTGISSNRAPGAGPTVDVADGGSFSQRMDDASRSVIVAALEENNWNQSAAAKMLGLHRNTLLSKIQKLNIQRGE